MAGSVTETAEPDGPNLFARGRLIIEWSALLLAATLLVAGLVRFGVTTRIDNAIYDYSLGLRHHAAPKSIILVGIDFPSMAKQGRWPWPRAVQASMLRNIALDHPKAIICDILFQSRGPMPDDEKVRDAMKLARVYLPIVLEGPTGKGHAGYLTEPTPVIASGATDFGRMASAPDRDGIVRRVRMFAGVDTFRSPHEKVYPEIALVVAGTAKEEEYKYRESLKGSPWAQALHDRNEVLIPFDIPPAAPVGPAGTTGINPGQFDSISADEAVNGTFKPGTFTGKYVLVGATAPGLLDNYPTPVSGVDGMPNVEVEANILDAVLYHHLARPLPLAVTMALSLGLVWTMFFGVLAFGPNQIAVQGPAVSILVLLGSLGALAATGYWFPPTTVIITRTLVQIIWSSRRLQAASDYFAQELLDLQTRAGGAMVPLSGAATLRMGDSVSRQMLLLGDTRRRIRELRRFVTDVLATLPDAVLVVTPRGRIITVNQAAITLGDRLGLSTAGGERVQPILAALEQGTDAKDRLWPPPAAGAGVAPRGLGPGGRILEARYTMLGGEAIHSQGWTIHLVDVTELVAVMRQREEALQLFTHDMRSPQSAILAALEREEFKVVPAHLRAGIERNALRTINLADGFVRLAQAEAAEYAFEAIDLFHLLGDAGDALWAIADAASVKIVVEDPGREYVIKADRGLLVRALVNLLDNAVKCSPPGKIVRCALAPASLHGHPAVACTIMDQASGMSQEQQKSLFKRFARSAAGSRETGERPIRSNSIGLGLAVVHAVVMRHDGTIDCQSEVGQGTVFTITLPLAGEPEGALAAVAATT